MAWGLVGTIVFLGLWIATLIVEEMRIHHLQAENVRREDEIKRLVKLKKQRDKNMHSLARDLHKQLCDAVAPMLATIAEAIQDHEESLSSGAGHSEGEVVEIAPRLYEQAADLKPLLSVDQERHLDALLNEYCGDPNRYRSLPQRALDHAHTLREYLESIMA